MPLVLGIVCVEIQIDSVQFILHAYFPLILYCILFYVSHHSNPFVYNRWRSIMCAYCLGFYNLCEKNTMKK